MLPTPFHKTLRSFIPIILLALALLLFSSAAFAAAPPLKSGIDLSNFDTSVKPADDFFQYVNGNWIKKNPIPAEYSRWGAFQQLRDENLIRLRQLVEGL